LSSPKTIIEDLIVPHAAFKEAQGQLELFFKYAAEKAEAEGLAILGESGTGKTSVLNLFADLHPRRRTASGIECPILRTTVPSAPTGKSLAGALLAGIGAEDHERGTLDEKTSRLKKLMEKKYVSLACIAKSEGTTSRALMQRCCKNGISMLSVPTTRRGGPQHAR
jgi:hypothetical protein